MLLLGHRGARSTPHLLENSISSFELCLQHGCDGFEFDVRLSADGVPVICHDPERAGNEIALTTAKVLNLSTLPELLERFHTRAFLDIELKVAGAEARLLSVLRAHPPGRDYVISSFLPKALTAIHQLNPTVPLGFLYDRQQTVPADLALTWLIPHFSLLTPELVQAAHARQVKVMTWTVNRQEDMRRFAEWDVDAIISDDTERLVQTLRHT